MRRASLQGANNAAAMQATLAGLPKPISARHVGQRRGLALRVATAERAAAAAPLASAAAAAAPAGSPAKSWLKKAGSWLHKHALGGYKYKGNSTATRRTYLGKALNFVKNERLSRSAKTLKTRFGRGVSAVRRGLLGTPSRRKLLGRGVNALKRGLGGRTKFYRGNRSWANWSKQIFSRNARSAQRKKNRNSATRKSAAKKYIAMRAAREAGMN